jgi:RNA polymerase sigma-70 factor, ECF subfamily
MSETPEAELVEAARSDGQAFGLLYDRYRDPIHNYICRWVWSCYEAEELVATVFEAALRGLPRYEQRSLPFGAWLYRIASNKVVDYQRQRIRHPQTTLEDASTVVDHAPGPGEQLDALEEQAALRRALTQLSAADQTVIMLIFFEEVDRRQAAAILECSVDAVYVRLHRALRRLRAVLEQQEEVPYA